MKMSRKVSFRVAPPVHEFLEGAALCSDTTLADFVRGCVEYILTGDPKRVPDFFADEGRVQLIADKVETLERLRQAQVDAVLTLDAGALDAELVQRLMKTVETHRGEVKLYFEVARPGAYRLMARAESMIGVRACQEFSDAVESVVGPNRLRYRTRKAAI